MTKLEKTTCYNPFFVEGYEIKKIHLYDDNGVIFSTRQGWFSGDHSYNEFDYLEIPDVKRRLKIDLAKKECFFTSVKGEWYEKGKFCEMYLYVDGVDIKLLDKILKSENMTHSEIWDSVTYTFEIKGVEIKQEILKEIKKTPFGLKVENLENELEGLNIKISKYDIERILQHYEVIKKHDKN